MIAALSRLAPGRTAADLAPHVAAHVAFMEALVARGLVVASGPFGTSGVGLAIVRADSIEAAHDALDGDPFVRAGLRAWDLHEWRIVEGRIA